SIDLAVGRRPNESGPSLLPSVSLPGMPKISVGPSAWARLGLILGAIAAVVLMGMSCGGPKPQSAASAPPTPVGVVKATQMDVPVHAEWVATLEGYVN